MYKYRLYPIDALLMMPYKYRLCPVGPPAEGPRGGGPPAEGPAEAPKDFTKPQQTIQSPDRLYKAPTDYTKPPKHYTNI